MRTHFFVDEAGNFDFSTNQGASKYFILTSVIMKDCDAADALLKLRRQMAWEGLDISGSFHATTDKQAVRDLVFQQIALLDIRIDATVFEKRKTIPSRQDALPFYKLARYHHTQGVIPRAVEESDELHVIAASLGTKNQQKQIAASILDVVSQCNRDSATTKISHWKCEIDPCLQVADYCCWAIQRKWERADSRSHVLTEHLIESEYEMWSQSQSNYY